MSLKLLSTTLGKVIVSATIVVMILIYFASSFLPSIGDFTSKVFPVEKNYKINGSSEILPVSLTDDLFVKKPGDAVTEWEIFSKLTGDETLISENAKVFIYKVDKDGITTLIDEIDSKPEVDVISEINSNVSKKWIVLYVIKNEDESAILKANYVFIS